MFVWQWAGVLLCLLHSAIFSGLNLGFFGLSRLRLEIQAETNDQDATRILNLRKDAHLLLATILWGNVASNVFLTLLTESILAGLGAFFFSTVGITFFGEIIPQAYLSRHALRVSSVLVPIVSFYRILLFPIAKPTALLLDIWLGQEEISYFKEEEFKIMLRRHGLSDLSDVERLESLGAMNFLELDDTLLEDEGEVINPASIITLPVTDSGLPLFPDFDKSPDDPFLQLIHSSQEKWIIITNDQHYPILVLNADQFLRDVVYGKDIRSLYLYCHRPIVVTEPGTPLGRVILKLKVQAKHADDDVVDNDLILFWNKEKRIITGADILGRLLRGIVKRVESRYG
jgi:metal transporter CNNM